MKPMSNAVTYSILQETCPAAFRCTAKLFAGLDVCRTPRTWPTLAGGGAGSSGFEVGADGGLGTRGLEGAWAVPVVPQARAGGSRRRRQILSVWLGGRLAPRVPGAGCQGPPLPEFELPARRRLGGHARLAPGQRTLGVLLPHSANQMSMPDTGAGDGIASTGLGARSRADFQVGLEERKRRRPVQASLPSSLSFVSSSSAVAGEMSSGLLLHFGRR